MNEIKAFFDANILIYLYSDSEPDKKQKALAEFNRYDRYTSTQALTELCNICLKKLRLSVSEVNTALDTIIDTCSILTVTDSDLHMALSIHDKYKYTLYDSLMIESALRTNCDVLLSEDMQHGQIIEKSLTIIDIFRN